ncbi:MAG: Dabb family protein [Chitinophagaceae bacterium]|nr:MAG: Dabb family protein [Chitinophagaceae bacterium]
MRTISKIIILLIGITVMNTSNINAQEKGKMLRHVVLIKFKDSSSPADVEKIEKAFAGLSKSIPLINSFEWGLNNSPENLNQGLTHCFLASFSSEKDRDAYLIHPKHKDFVALAGPHFDKVTVVDYWVK